MNDSRVIVAVRLVAEFFPGGRGGRGDFDPWGFKK